MGIAALRVGARLKERNGGGRGEENLTCPISSSPLEFQHGAFASKNIRAPKENALFTSSISVLLESKCVVLQPVEPVLQLN